MTTQTNDIRAVEGQFFRSLGDGRKAGEYLQTMIQSVVSSRDTTVLVRAIDRAENEKHDEQAAKIIRSVVRAVWPGAKLSKDKNGQPRITIKGIDADTTALAALSSCVKDNLSMRHHTFLKRINPPSAAAVSFTEKNVEAFLKRAAKAGVSITAAIAMVQTKGKAMQEEARQALAAGEEPAH